METNLYRRASELFHVLSHQAWLPILDEVRKDEACVCHLQTVLRRPRAYVSQQLRVVRDAGMVADRKDGVLAYYRLADPQPGFDISGRYSTIAPIAGVVQW